MKLAIIGDPVDHSRSPRIHREFLREAHIDGSYDAIRVPLVNCIEVIRRMRIDDYFGCNVTTPLKEEAVRACDVLTDHAQRAGAVNTILFGMEILGTNTDGIGARIALETLLDEPVALKRIGVLGTGSTARAILAELSDNDAYTYVWGRSPERIASCCNDFGAKLWPFDNPPELLISTLPPNTRLEDELIASCLWADIVMDANYGERSTLSRRLEREVVDGALMLEAQARASFDFWLSHYEPN